jgi:hypothetical protein
MIRCAPLGAQTALSVTLATSSLAALTRDQVPAPAQSETVQAVAEDREPAAGLAQGRATADRWAQAAQVAGRARAELAGRASAVDWALDRALARAAFLELASPERAFLEGLAGVAESEGQDEVWSDRYS